MQPLSNIYVSVAYSVLVGDSNCVCVRELYNNEVNERLDC